MRRQARYRYWFSVPQVTVSVPTISTRLSTRPGMPGLLESLVETVGTDAVTWGTLNQ